MNEAPASSSRPAAPGFHLARLARLARKELRETLRDRRTVITLVVMPVLVYTMLGLAFRQFLVTSSTQKPLSMRIATKTEQEWRTLRKLLGQGEQVLEGQGQIATSAPLTGGPILGVDLGETDLPLSENDIFAIRPEVTESLEDLIRANAIDLGVRLLPAEATTASRGEYQFQLIYRPDTPISRKAANFVQRRLEAANASDFQKRLSAAGDKRPPGAAWRLVPVAEEKGHSFWLGTLVPLVLILMTITGAVYPAIDLTAGERERGTLESLMAAPVPRLAVLIAKYIAVLTVAMLTASVNLTAMTVVIASTGLGPFLFGEKGLAPQSILAVLVLLVLFAAFFSAVLLLITSFARSFKEAQAYVIPLMVVSLAPGFMSVMPGWELDHYRSVIPLANMVLLARDVLEGDAPLLWGAVAVVSTILYGGFALALAARVFGSDAILYGSEGSWSDLFRQPRERKRQPTITDALAALALVMPLFIIASGLLVYLGGAAIESRLLAGAGVSLLIFLALPLAIARAQSLQLTDGFQLRRAPAGIFVAAVVLGATLWPLAYDLIVLCRDLGIATLTAAKIEEHRGVLEELVTRLRAVSPLTVILTLAIVPAIGEEFFFRGYLLGALRGRLPAWWAILITAFIFGLFHASVFGLIAVERVASSTLLGIALGWLCWRSGSVLPGMILHAISNSIMISLVYFAEHLTAWGFDAQEQRYLPLALVAVTTIIAALSVFAIAWLSRQLPTSTAEHYPS